MFKILVIDDDDANNKKIEDTIKGKPSLQLHFAQSAEQAVELMIPKKKESESKTAILPAPIVPDLIFVENNKITGPPEKWHQDFHEVLKMVGNENIPIILLSHSNDALLIRGFLAPEVQDVLVKPIISSLLENMLNYYSGEKKELARNIVPISGKVEMFYQATAKEISEFEMKIVTSRQLAIDEFKPLFGDFFKWTPNRRAIGRCTDCKKDEEVKGSFIETFTFVGVPPGITKEIRIWLRNEYVTQKQKNL